MGLKLDGMRFFADGGHEGDRHVAWATLRMTFTAVEESAGHPDVSLSIPLLIDPERTFGEQEKIARDHALSVLREAVRLLEVNSIAELNALAAEIWEAKFGLET